MKKILKWTRNNFPKIDENLSVRDKAEEETSRDFQKPIQQLLCDAHEEAINGQTVGTLKRMNSLLTIIAYENRRSNRLITWLTIIITIFTFILVVKELNPLWPTAGTKHSETVPQPIKTQDNESGNTSNKTIIKK